MKNYIKFLGILAIGFQLQSCGETVLPDPNPGGHTGKDFTININQSPYTSLQQVGGSAIVASEKVIVARLSGSSWAALSSYCPSDQSVPLTYTASNQTFRCSKDNSTFNSEGKVTSGSSSPLTKYSATLSVNSGDLRIFEP